MNRNKIIQFMAMFICFGMVFAAIPAAIAIVEDNEIPIGVIKDEEDWWMKQGSNYTGSPPVIDGNLSDWNISSFQKQEIHGDGQTWMDLAFNNNQTDLYIALKGENMTLPPNATRNGDDGPPWDMFILAFDADDDGFDEDDNVLLFYVYWNMTNNLTMVAVDTFLDGNLYDKDDGPGFNMTGDTEQNGQLAINFTGPKMPNATGDYIMEISFPLDSGDAKDFSLAEGFDWSYGFKFTLMMFDVNTKMGFGMNEFWVDLSYLDTDGDGYPDKWEQGISNETNATSTPPDNDMDFWPDAYDDDDDDDGYSDADEIAAGSNPMDPFDTPPDTDGDGIPDLMDEDMDGDGFSNYDEQLAGTNAMDPASHPAIVVQDLIDNGLDWLTLQQEDDGSWDYNVGVTALCLLSYLNNNITEENDTVSDAIDYLVSEINFNWNENNPPIDQDATYSASMTILALKATMNTSYTDEINTLGEWLEQTQWDEDNLWGGMNDSDPMYGGWRYGYNDSSSDLSVTQWALMGIDAWGNLSKDDGLWQRALIFLEKCQSNVSGGFTYMPKQKEPMRRGPPNGNGSWDPGYGSMTAAGIWSLMLCGLNVTDARVQAGVGWFERNYTWKENPNSGDQWVLYYIITLAKALTMVGMDEIEVTDGTYAGDGIHVWMDDMVENLTARKVLNESYWEGSDRGPELATAYALLSLETQNLPEGANYSAVFTLHSACNLHIYDDEGRHIGVLEGTEKVEVAIPGATYLYKGHLYSYSPDIQEVVDGVEDVQEIILPLTEAGVYTIELVGTAEGDYELEIVGYIGEREVSSAIHSGDISPEEVHSTNVVVTSMEGPLTIFSQEPGEIPALGISPAAIVGSVEPSAIFNSDIVFSEVSSIGPIDDVEITANALVSGANTIPATNVTVNPVRFDLTSGGTQTVSLFVKPSEGLPDGTYVGTLSVESSAGMRNIPINLEVSSEIYGFTISSTEKAKEVAEAGGNATYSIQVVNNANGPDVIDLEITSVTASWTAELMSSSVSLLESGRKTVQLEVTAPVNATDGEIGTVTVTVTSQNDLSLVETLILVTTVNITPIAFTIGPFDYDDGTPIVGASVDLINAVPPENLTTADQSLSATTNTTGMVSFKALPGLLWGNLTKDGITVSFSLVIDVTHAGAILNTTSLTGWTAPAKPLETYTVNVGPITDKDGNPVANATVSFVYLNITYDEFTDANGTAKFTMPVKTISSGIEITAIKGEDSITWSYGDDIPKLGEETKDEAGEEDDPSSLMWIIIPIVIVVIMLMVLFVIIWHKKGAEPMPSLEEEGLERVEEEEEEDWDDGEPPADDEGWDDYEDDYDDKYDDKYDDDHDDDYDDKYDDDDDDDYDDKYDDDYDDDNYDEEDEFYD